MSKKIKLNAFAGRHPMPGDKEAFERIVRAFAPGTPQRKGRSGGRNAAKRGSHGNFALVRKAAA
jgi:hypothetical protein